MQHHWIRAFVFQALVFVAMGCAAEPTEQKNAPASAGAAPLGRPSVRNPAVSQQPPLSTIAAEASYGLGGSASGNPVLVQTRFGAQGNFELIVPASDAGMLAYWRDNDDAAFPWRGPFAFGESLGHIDSITFVENRNGLTGAYELIARTGENLFFFWRTASSPFTWQGPIYMGTGATGTPSMIQSSFGQNGNFELATPAAAGGIDMYWRDNDDMDAPVWYGPYNLASELGQVSDVTLIQSTYGEGNLELVARIGSQLVMFWRSATGDLSWNGPYAIADDAAGGPTLHQLKNGDFELVVPSSSGGVDSYTRHNSVEGLPWTGPTAIGRELGSVGAATMIQSNFGSGNLELVLRQAERLVAYYRGDEVWYGPYPLSAPLTTPEITGPTALQKSFTEVLGTLTGRPGWGAVNDLGDYGMTGTDLGASFEYQGNVVFLFGDTLSKQYPDDHDLDSMAISSATSVEWSRMPKLDFVRRPGSHRFSPLVVPEASGIPIQNREMRVPVEGFAVGNRMYVVFATDYSEVPDPTPENPNRKKGLYGRAVLAHRDDANGTVFTPDYTLPSNDFINVSVVQSDGYLYIYGAGNPYRQSPIRLARVAIGDIGSAYKWEYFQGTRGSRPAFSPWKSSAAEVIPVRCAGEFNVRRHDATGLYLMTYNCGEPTRGIQLRTAPNPWGPWSEPTNIFDVGRDDHGYMVAMHMNRSNHVEDHCNGVGFDDGLGQGILGNVTCTDDARGGDIWGGEYGPYMVPRWFTSNADGSYSIVWLLSTWNPYTVSLMRTVVTPAGVTPIGRPAYGSDLPPSRVYNGDFSSGLYGWEASGAPFSTRWVAGSFRAYAPFGTVGSIAQDIAVDAKARSLNFFIHSGGGTARLYHNGELVRQSSLFESRGSDLQVSWALDPYRGSTVRVVIEAPALFSFGMEVSDFRVLRDL